MYDNHTSSFEKRAANNLKTDSVFVPDISSERLALFSSYRKKLISNLKIKQKLAN